MLSALWFLRACTKCDFGEYADKDTNIPGMPPPILYLNGYNQIMDNIPVLIERVDFTLPEDKVKILVDYEILAGGKINA